MRTTLERVLQSIDPARTWDEVGARADDAINSFPLAKSCITEWNEFRSCMIQFLRHLECRVLRLANRTNASTDFEWGRCVRLLIREYGKSGEKAAFELARTGVEGGLNAVLRGVARRVGEQYAEGEIAARVGRWWNGLSLDEKTAATTEYLERYGHLLPSELTEGSAARVRAEFPRVLMEHTRLLQRTRRVGR
jgi:hypothetical protein